MADWQFKSARLMHTVVMLEFQPVGGGHPLSLAVQIENASQLTAGLLNALKKANEEGRHVPKLDLAGEQTISVTLLPVDRWAVSESPVAPDHKLLHLLAAGGLSLTYSLDANQSQFVGEALTGGAADTPNTRRN